jgi:hypothetical protein
VTRNSYTDIIVSRRHGGHAYSNATASRLAPRCLRRERARRRRRTGLSGRSRQDPDRSSLRANRSIAASRSRRLWRRGDLQARDVQASPPPSMARLHLHGSDLWSGTGLPHNRDARSEEGCPRLVQRDQRQVIRRRASQRTLLTSSETRMFPRQLSAPNSSEQASALLGETTARLSQFNEAASAMTGLPRN